MPISSDQSLPHTSEPDRVLSPKFSTQPPSLTWLSSLSVSASSGNSVCVSVPTAASILLSPGATQRSSAISLLTRTGTLAERSVWSSAGRRRKTLMSCSRSTAGSTRNALTGSRRGRLALVRSMLGVLRQRGNATSAPLVKCLSMNSRSGRLNRKAILCLAMQLLDSVYTR